MMHNYKLHWASLKKNQAEERSQSKPEMLYPWNLVKWKGDCHSFHLGLIRVDDLLYPPPTRPLGLLPDPYLNPGGYLIPIAPKSLKKSWIWVKKFEFLVTQRTLKSFGAKYTSKCLCLQVSLYIGLIETDKWTTTEEFPFTKWTVEGWRRHKCFQTDTSNGHYFILELCQ